MTPTGEQGKWFGASDDGGGTSLEALIEAFGTVLLDVVVAPRGLEATFTDVAIYDSDDLPNLVPGSVALGVGIQGAGAVADVLYELGGAGASALCVKLGGGELDPRSKQAAEAAGVAVLSVASGASWLHLASLMRSLLSARAAIPGDGPGDTDGANLFAIADAATDVIGGPVTIEDESLRVLAFSVADDMMDDGRRETILGRRVPEHWVAALREHDILHRVYASRKPIYFELDGMLPRVACAIRAGDELLGSMWAVVAGPVSEAQMRQFKQASSVAALHLLRERGASRAIRRSHAAALIGLLFGRGGGADTVERLGLAGKRLRIIAVGPAHDDWGEQSVERHWSALELYLASYRVAGSLATSGRLLYGAIVVDQDDATSLRNMRQLAKNYTSLGDRGTHVRIGIGSAGGIDNVDRSRREAEDALRVIGHDERRGPIAAIDEVRSIAVLQRVIENLTAEDLESAGLQRLELHDAEHQTAYLETLSTYLFARGDVTRAADALHVHANTVRYRLRKMHDISGLDLDNPDEWMSLSLILAGRSRRSGGDGVWKR